MTKYKTVKDFSLTDQLAIAEDCGEFMDEDQTLDDIFQAWRYGQIGDRWLIIYVDQNGELFLRVNGCTSVNTKFNPPVPSHIGRAIWLWFFEAWADIVEQLGPDIDCYLMPEDSDGYFDKRVKNFKLMGFELVTSNKMRYKSN